MKAAKEFLPRRCDAGIVRFVEYMERGLRVGGVWIGLARAGRGRFGEELNLVVGIKGGQELFHAKVFCGRGYYRPWIEVHSISSIIPLGGSPEPMSGSYVEKWLLDSAADSLAPGSPLYIEYYWDEETTRQLDLGVPAHLSRLGYELFIRGFTWFKVWYYPEGFAEGGQKIQAEKPLDEARRAEHLREIISSTREFLERHAPTNYYIRGAVERARRVLGLSG